MKVDDRILRLINCVELEPCRYKRMNMMGQLWDLDKKLGQIGRTQTGNTSKWNIR